MIRYLARRAGHGLLMLFGVSILMFLLFQAAPGDFLSDARVNSQISAETMAQAACPIWSGPAAASALLAVD